VAWVEWGLGSRSGWRKVLLNEALASSQKIVATSMSTSSEMKQRWFMLIQNDSGPIRIVVASQTVNQVVGCLIRVGAPM
jgi:hypothetical protein